jgi:hypothetical protein
VLQPSQKNRPTEQKKREQAEHSLVGARAEQGADGEPRAVAAKK